jgi:hypothetical protein
MRLLAQVPLHPEVNSQNDGDDGYGANHQNRKQNLHHHGSSGYQNGVTGNVIFLRPKCAFTRTRFVPGPMPQSSLATPCTLLFLIDTAVSAV